MCGHPQTRPTRLTLALIAKNNKSRRKGKTETPPQSIPEP